MYVFLWEVVLLCYVNCNMIVITILLSAAFMLYGKKQNNGIKLSILRKSAYNFLISDIHFKNPSHQ